MRLQTVVPSTPVRLRRFLSRGFSSLSTRARFHSHLGIRFVRTALLLMTGITGLTGSVAAADSTAIDSAAAGVPAAASAPIKVPMTAEHWQVESAAFEKIQGMDAIALHQGGYAIAKNVTLKDGTIEFDVQPMVMGTGMIFRRADEKNFEMFYFRP